MSVIDAVRQLVMKVGVTLRAIPKVFGILCDPPDPGAVVPSASGTRWWWQRLGLFALCERLDPAKCWREAPKYWSRCSANGKTWNVKNRKAASPAWC